MPKYSSDLFQENYSGVRGLALALPVFEVAVVVASFLVPEHVTAKWQRGCKEPPQSAALASSTLGRAQLTVHACPCNLMLYVAICRHLSPSVAICRHCTCQHWIHHDWVIRAVAHGDCESPPVLINEKSRRHLGPKGTLTAE